MNSSHISTTVNQSNHHFNLTDTDLSPLLASSLVPTTISNDSMDNVNNNNNNNTMEDVLLNQFREFVYSPMSNSSMSDQQSFGPPPGFEHFRLDSSISSDYPLHQTNIPVSSSDTVNFSQLLSSSTIVDSQQQQQSPTTIGNLRSSSHSSFTSDDQSLFASTYSSSSYATRQIYSPNTTLASSTTKSHLPNGLSFNNNNNNHHHHPHHYSSTTTASTSSSSSLLPPNSTTDSPIENEKRIADGSISSSHIFSSNNSFFTNERTDYPSSKSLTNQLFSTTARTSSSASSSSSIDDALIQLTQKQQQQQTNLPKLFNDPSNSFFQFPSLPSTSSVDHQQEDALHENLNFLASMAVATSPVTPLDSPQRSTNSLQSISTRNSSITMQDLIQNLNDLCDKGFDELNALIQEQRWVQSYVNINGSLISSSNSSSNCCSSRILIVCEYFIFKCKKVEMTASQIFEFLAMSKAELRLRDLMFVFKTWKDSIDNAERIHQEEENKLRLTTEHPQSYYITESDLQSAFDRIAFSIRQLCHVTQQVRAAFQYATWNVFQTSSRQSNQSHSSINSTNPAQIQAMQTPQKSVSIHRSNGFIRNTP